jgi:hypothetical protein
MALRRTDPNEDLPSKSESVPRSAAEADLAGRLSALCGWGALASAAVRASLRCEKANQKTVAVLSHRDLDIGVRGNAQVPLPDRNRFLGRIEADLKNLLRSFELTNESLELALLLFAHKSRGAQLARPRAGFVHESRIGLPNLDHLLPLSSSRIRVAFFAALHGGMWTIRFRRGVTRCRVEILAAP